MPLPTYFLSHGGGPWPAMKSEMPGVYDRLEASLRQIPRDLPAPPDAILVATGHWEEPEFTVQTAASPGMIYDYSGFPEHTYQIRYPAPGSPALAARVLDLLHAAGFAARGDSSRGFDHGTFVPLMVAYPEATVPVVQLSIRRDYDPAAHLAAGRALAPLRDTGILILASGLSYHNLRQFGPAARVPSHEFDAWLYSTLCESTPDERARRLTAWTDAPSARRAHPREDHLIPLMVAVGAAGSAPAARVFHEDDFFGGIAVSSYRFE
jgi:aromatic ring-opening dioxygenase catalytic subunit (LigB family)